jgi:AraC family transcriptional regulator
MHFRNIARCAPASAGLMAGIAIDIGEAHAAAQPSTVRELGREFGQAIEPVGTRTALHQGQLALVEDWFVAAGSSARPSYDPSFQLVLTYFGLCTFVSGETKQLIDSNRSLLVAPGWSAFDVGNACPAGYAAVLIKPSRELLEQISSNSGSGRLRIFAERSVPSTMRLRLLTQLLRSGAAMQPLEKEECVVQAIAEAIGSTGGDCARSSKAVERTKELLHAHAGERLQLDEIAAEVGLNSVYLTQEFTRCEGVPLYRYQLQLRLTRALLKLPGCKDITGLALDLGFSSHSHFTCVFRKAFGTTPSQYRTTIGAAKSPVRPNCD